MIKLELSSKNKFYSNIRDFNFSYLGLYLHNKVKEIEKFRADHAKNQKNQNIGEMSEFLDKFKIMHSEKDLLMNHVCLADYITKKTKHPIFAEIIRMEQYMLYDDLPAHLYEFYESEIAKQSDMVVLLRIMCIESLVHNGLKPKLYDSIKRDFMNVKFYFILIYFYFEKFFIFLGVWSPRNFPSKKSGKNENLKKTRYKI